MSNFITYPKIVGIQQEIGEFIELRLDFVVIFTSNINLQQQSRNSECFFTQGFEITIHPVLRDQRSIEKEQEKSSPRFNVSWGESESSELALNTLGKMNMVS